MSEGSTRVGDRTEDVRSRLTGAYQPGGTTQPRPGDVTRACLALIRERSGLK